MKTDWVIDTDTRFTEPPDAELSCESAPKLYRAPAPDLDRQLPA